MSTESLPRALALANLSRMLRERIKDLGGKELRRERVEGERVEEGES